MVIAAATPHSSYCCGQCGEDRVFPSEDFVKVEEECNQLMPRQAAVLWEDEREECIDGNVFSCMRYGLLSRIQHIASCCMMAPAEALFSLCALTACTLLLPVRLYCYGAKVLCPDSDLVCPEKTDLCHRYLIFSGVFHAADACYKSVTFPCDVLCPEVESFCGVHQANVRIEKTIVAELNRRAEAVFQG